VGSEAEDAEVVGGGAGDMGVDAGVEYGAGDAGGVGRKGEGSDVAKVLRGGDGCGSVAEGGKGAGLEEERGDGEEGLQAAASLRRMKDCCGLGCFPMG
jgi:hypothetical protein